MDQKLTTKILLLLFTVGGFLLTAIGVSYAFFTSEQFGLTDNILKTGTVVFSYNEGENAINLSSTEPTEDYEALLATSENSYFDFSVTYNNRSQKRIDYDITLLQNVLENENIMLDSKYVKVALSEIPNENASIADEKNVITKYFDQLELKTNGSRIIRNDYLEVESKAVTKWYRLRVWLPKQDANGKEVTLKNDLVDPETGIVLEKGTAEKQFSLKTGIVTK